MKRTIPLRGLLFASISAIIGSGWLFSAYYTTQLAGPASLLSWIIGGGALIFLAFVFAEPCTLLPVSGSSTRIPFCTYGTLVSFCFAWITWLAYTTYIAAEAQAVIQYASFFYPRLTVSSGALTKQGYVVISFIVLGFTILNIYSLRWLIRSNNILTFFKILIPAIIAVTLLVLFFKAQRHINFRPENIFPFGWKGVFYAISSGGIVFAFNGFKQAAEMAGEANKPSRDLPIAIIGSVIICLILYILLQFAFLLALQPSNLVHGWGKLTFYNNTSPFASLLYEHHYKVLMPLLYIAAIIAPLAAGLMYFNAAARSLYGMSCNGYLPPIFRKLNPSGNPVYAVLMSFIVSMFLLLLLPGWDAIATFLSALLAFSYVVGPLSLIVLRKRLPNIPRPFRLKGGIVWSGIAFFICTMLIYWCGWDIIYKLDISMILGFILLFIYVFITRKKRKIELDWQAAIWVWIYFIGITLVSYLGCYGGGKNIIQFGYGFFILAVFSFFIIILAVKLALPASVIQKHIDEQLKIEE